MIQRERHALGTLLLSAAAASSAAAQDTYLVKDINTSNFGPVSSTPAGFTAVGTQMFFAADRPDVGRELWRSVDNAAPELVADLHPFAGSDPLTLTEFGGLLFFTAETPERGRELWVSDGTSGGTQLVIDLQAGAKSSDPESLTVLGDELYFSARGPGVGRELWKTDGTEAGTALVADINPGGAWSTPEHLTVAGGVLYFAADDGTFGRELWRTDGTGAGTQLVSNIAQGGASSYPVELAECNGELYFSAAFNNDREPYRVDPASGAAQLLGNLNTTGSSDPGSFVSVGTSVFFTAWTPSLGRELWRTDGTPAGTQISWDVLPGASDGAVRALSEVDGQLVLLARHATQPFVYHFHIGDGTEAGSFKIGTVEGETLPPLPAPPFTAANGSHFLATKAGLLVWSGGPQQIQLLPGSMDTDLALGSDGNRVWFSFDETESGSEPWVSDGSSAGTGLLVDLAPGNQTGNGLASPDMQEFNGEALFRVSLAQGNVQLWKSDGSANGTQPFVGTPPPWTTIASFEVVGDRVAVVGKDGTGKTALWSSDGSASGTFMVAGTPEFIDSDIFDLNGTIIFGGTNAQNDAWLWRVDGAVATPFADLVPGNVHVDVHDITPFAGKLYFITDHLISFGLLWSTDGTAAGTSLVDPGLSRVASPTVIGDRLVFRGTTLAATDELYAVDEAGQLSLVADIAPGVPASAPNGFARAGDTLVFRAASNGTSFPLGVFWELWRTDGTAAGTDRVSGLTSALDPVYGIVSTAGDWSYFWFETGSGDELWRTDGTTAGTEIVPGPDPLATYPDGYTHTFEPGFGDGGSAFVQVDQGWGSELWKVDENGVELFADISNDPADSNPSDFLRAGAHIFFVADDGVTGRELYAVPYVETEAHLTEKYGAGCPGTGGLTPRIGANASPLLGTAVDIEIAGALPNSAAALFHSYSKVPIALGNCTLHLGFPFFLTGTTPTDAAGDGAVTVNFPPTSQLTGVPLYLQYLVADPGGAYEFIASFSDALELVPGP